MKHSSVFVLCPLVIGVLTVALMTVPRACLRISHNPLVRCLARNKKPLNISVQLNERFFRSSIYMT